MGIVENLAVKAIKHVVKKKVDKIVLNGTATAFDTLEKKGRDAEEVKFLSETDNIRLLLREEGKDNRRRYDVFNQANEHLYCIEADGKRKIRLRDVAKNECGYVELAHKDDGYIAKIYSDNAKLLGKIKQAPVKKGASWKKNYYDTSFNEWLVEADVVGSKYAIINKNETIATFEHSGGMLVRDYMVDVVDVKDITMVLLIMIALLIRLRR